MLSFHPGHYAISTPHRCESRGLVMPDYPDGIKSSAHERLTVFLSRCDKPVCMLRAKSIAHGHELQSRLAPRGR